MKHSMSTTLPDTPEARTMYRLTPNAPSETYYRERTDRNIGWITRGEQELLRRSTIGIAGCGGMGGLLGSIFVRLGVGEVRIADTETFDASNINRQFAAGRRSIGVSKAFETARLVRAVSDDTNLVVYPQGITEETAEEFVSGCDVICDEVELLAVHARILLHKTARALGVSLLNCNTVGFGTNLFLYTPTSMTMEEAIGLTYEQAKFLRDEAEFGDEEASERLANAIMRAVIPEVPSYAAELDGVFRSRILKEKKAPIIATNPPLASGFLADRTLLYLLRNSGVKRDIVATPPMPAYLHFDAARMEAKVVSPWRIR